ncbi:hypothetical protein RJ639_021202 [Escallonia herrerae]|uniref:Non-haem dioxygenase N-terminal domain-containing protein n=1 Tax=Escallonia herrerae TaxID=1293975 RepID=A0AA89AGB1_9ASTE|nr:hypothetical protein RJ639_021202 [Escallonia herrerae]
MDRGDGRSIRRRRRSKLIAGHGWLMPIDGGDIETTIWVLQGKMTRVLRGATTGVGKNTGVLQGETTEVPDDIQGLSLIAILVFINQTMMEVASRPIRVQSIAQSGAAPQVPPEYIQPPETRPNNPTARLANNNSIPSIDLSSAVRDAIFLRTKIGAACREWGAFHVTNHGVPPKLLDEIKRMGRTFFEACPMDEKLRYSCDTSGAATEGKARKFETGLNPDVQEAVAPFNISNYHKIVDRALNIQRTLGFTQAKWAQMSLSRP